MEARVGDTYRRSRNTHARKDTSPVKPYQISGHERSHVFDDVDPSSGDSYREIIPPQDSGGTKVPPPSQTRPSISLLNINEEFCSAYVGRNDGYKRSSPHDLTTATSPRLLNCDVSATTSVRTTSTGSTLLTTVEYAIQRCAAYKMYTIKYQ